MNREERGRGRQEGLGLVQTQRWEQFIVEMGAGDGDSLYQAVRNQARAPPASEHGWLKLGQPLNGAH